MLFVCLFGSLARRLRFRYSFFVFPWDFTRIDGFPRMWKNVTDLSFRNYKRSGFA